MRTSFFLLLLALFGLSSCKDFETTDSGLQYKFFTRNENGKKPKEGDIVRFHFVNKNQNDSVLMTTYKMGKPFEVTTQKPRRVADMMEALLMMAEGDSAVFRLSADSMLKDGPLQGINPGDVEDFYIKMVKVLTKDEYQKELVSAHEERVKQQNPVLDKYIADKGLTDVKVTPSGLRYTVKNEGAGPKPTPGSMVKVHYKGYLMNGTVFDESYTRNEPYELMLGVGEVIPGWDEGLSYFAKGGKGILIVPSYLGYGEKGNGPIPPSSPLIFEIEMVDVKAAAQPSAPPSEK